MTTSWRSRAKRWFGPHAVVRARTLLRGRPWPRWGNLRRLRPFSESFGADRGTPVDRYYLHRFLDGQAALIRGDVLEIQLPSYTGRFGHDVRVSHTVDIREEFHPTYCCDLAEASMIPDESYDCFLMPNTLQHLRRLEPALAEAWRVVRPGGAIVASAAGLLRLTAPDEDLWRCSPEGWREVATRVWPHGVVEVTGHGNCLAAVAALYGLAHEELSDAELDYQDSRFPVLTTIVCRKPRHAAAPSEGDA